MTLDATWARDWIDRTADVVEAERHGLSELDRQIGDGDHGENLARGFSAVRDRLGELPPPPHRAPLSDSWPRRSSPPSAAPRARSSARPT
nr:hypothetical protein GCM10025699_54390 [Microbacterium flavescens]